jgi:hypothetical protein
MKKPKRQSKIQPAPEKPPATRRHWLAPLLIFIIAFALRLNTVYTGPYGHTRVLRGHEPQSVAESLVRTGQFANPFHTPTGPTAHLAPFQPFLLAALTKVFPGDASYETAKQILSSAAASLQYALLPLAAAALGLSRATGITAATIAIATFAFLPKNVQPIETQGTWEASYAALALVLLTIAFKKSRPVIFGIVSGLTILVTPTAALVAAAYLAMRKQKLAVLAALLTLLPWTARNLLVLGSPVWGRDNLGLELEVANNDCAASKFTVNRHSGCFESHHPNMNPAEAAAVIREGEPAYNSRKLHTALAWMSQNPARFAALTAERIQLFWFPEIGSSLLTIVTIMGFAGAALLFKRNRPAFWPLAIPLALYPPVYYVTQNFPRYRYPILWISFLLAGYALVRLCGAVKPHLRALRG